MSLLILLFVFCVFNLVFFLVVLYNNPKSATNRLFGILILVLALYLILNTLIYEPPDYLSIVFLGRSIMAVASFINLFVFLFLITFPKDKIPLQKKYLYLLSVITLALFFLSYTNLIFKEILVVDNLVKTEPGRFIFIFLLHTIFLVFGGIILAFLGYRRSQGLIRNKIKFVLLSFFLLFFFIIVFNFILTAFFGVSDFVPFLPLYLILFNFFISYAIIKHRFLDIRLLVVRSVAYTLLVLILGFGYTLAMYLFHAFITKQETDIFSMIPSVILALIIAFTFNPLLRILENITDKVFYKSHYSQTELLNNLNRIMASTVILDEMAKQVINAITKTMRVSHMCIGLFETEHKFFSQSDSTVKKCSQEKMEQLLKYASKTEEKIIIADELSEGKEKQIMREHDSSIIFPLSVKNNLIGGISLGPKSSGDIYSKQDIEVIKIMAPEISIAIKNALSYEEISQFNVRLKHEVEKATDKLRKANSRLREIDKQKDEFVSIASHELRTPMTSIKGYLWLALNRHQNELSEELKHKLEISYNSSERLIHMVNDMLTISRIEKNKIELNTEKIDLVPLLQQLYDELKIQADQKGIKFELVKGKDSYLVEGDKDKLREVFQNLLGNALKFVQEGYVKIILKQDKDKVFVKIEDTGPGIPEEEQDKLFQKFGKGKHAYRQQSNIEGTGLGLYISSKVISLHGGKIDVESELDKGTTFIVVLPVCSNNDKK